MRFWKSRPMGMGPDHGERGGATPQSPDVAALRGQVLAALQDCVGHRADVLRLRLQRASCSQDLWLARCEVYQLVATQHCEAQAVSRINALLPAFRQCLPARSLADV